MFFCCLPLPGSLSTTSLEQESGHSGQAGCACRAHLQVQALPESPEDRLLPPLCLMRAEGPAAESPGEPAQKPGLPERGPPWVALVSPAHLYTVQGASARSCQQQVTCGGIALWARWTLEVGQGLSLPESSRRTQEWTGFPLCLSRGQNISWFVDPKTTGIERWHFPSLLHDAVGFT